MTFQIEEAKRTGARLLIQLSGVSGSGKTYSALQLAYGLAGGDSSKIIGIDTENRRMSLNADCLPNGARFRIINFFAPFSPARYIQAIEAACKNGAKVIVIDSVTHEWESEGGCEWIAAQNQKMPNWKLAKAEHKRFMTYMLQCPAHIIACTRAREKTDFTDTRNPKSLGIQPIQEKNFSFEATVSLLMENQGRTQQVLKCPADLEAVLGRGKGYITAEDGLALRQWVDGAAPLDPAVEHARGQIQNATVGGVMSLRTAWAELTPKLRKSLGEDFLASCKASAEEYDRQRQQQPDSIPDELAALNAAASE